MKSCRCKGTAPLNAKCFSATWVGHARTIKYVFPHAPPKALSGHVNISPLPNLAVKLVFLPISCYQNLSLPSLFFFYLCLSVSSSSGFADARRSDCCALPRKEGPGHCPKQARSESSTTVAGPDDYTCTQTRRRKVILISPDPDKYSTLAFGFICFIATTSSVTPPHSVNTAPLTASAVHHKRLSGLRTSCAAGIVSKVCLLRHPGTRIEDQHGN